MDPDPFDDRHPGRAVPTCALGHLMKTLFKNEDFMNKVKKSFGELFKISLSLLQRHWEGTCIKHGS